MRRILILDYERYGGSEGPLFLPVALVTSMRATSAAHVPDGKSRFSVQPVPANIADSYPSVPAPYSASYGERGMSMRARTLVNPVSSDSKDRAPLKLQVASTVRPSYSLGSVPGPALYARVAERLCGTRCEAVQHAIEAFTSCDVT